MFRLLRFARNDSRYIRLLHPRGNKRPINNATFWLANIAALSSKRALMLRTKTIKTDAPEKNATTAPSRNIKKLSISPARAKISCFDF